MLICDCDTIFTDLAVLITLFIILWGDYSKLNLGLNIHKFNELKRAVIADAKMIMFDRDNTHGLDHVLRVYELAKQIRWAGGDKIDKLIMEVAILHDSYDHKYPNAAKNKSWVKDMYGDDIVNAIDHISYSSEVSYHIKDPNISINLSRMRWLSNLSNDVLLARNVVSDADKLEAIGRRGIDRCLDFIKHKHPEIIHDDEQVNILLKQHYDEKLKLLAQYYIVTQKGKQMAQILDQEMTKYLKQRG